MSASVALTGATGYLGGIVSAHLDQRGDRVTAFNRTRPSDPEAHWREFNLGQTLDGPALDDVDVLIHGAWVLSGANTADLWEQNVVGSRQLIESAVAAGISKIVFVSSMSAFFGTRQAYGLMKLAVERTVLDLGGIVVRPGLVYGESPGGMAGTLKKVAALPIWPRFKSAKLYLAHEGDLAPALTQVLESFEDFAGQVLGFAHPVAHDLTTVLAGLSSDHTRKPTVLVPTAAVMGSLRLVERANVPLPFRSDSLLGLVAGPSQLPGQEVLRKHGISFRGLTNGRSKPTP